MHEPSFLLQKMKVLIITISILFIFFAFQLFWFRVRIPKNQIRFILIAYPTIGLLILTLLTSKLLNDIPKFQPTLYESIYIGLVLFIILPSYVILYGLIDAESPSSLMILFLEAAGAKGLSRSDFNSLLSDELFLWHRMRGLEIDGFVAKEDDAYRITRKGKIFMHFWLIPRYLAGKESYGG